MPSKPALAAASILFGKGPENESDEIPRFMSCLPKEPPPSVATTTTNRNGFGGPAARLRRSPPWPVVHRLVLFRPRIYDHVFSENRQRFIPTDNRMGQCRSKVSRAGKVRSMVSGDAQSLPLIQLLARGDPLRGVNVNRLSAVTEAGWEYSVRTWHRYFPRNGAVPMFTVKIGKRRIRTNRRGFDNTPPRFDAPELQVYRPPGRRYCARRREIT
jgi:hypothetical protein